MNVADLTSEQIKEARKKLLASNIRVSAISSPLGKINTADYMDAEMARAERIFSAACELEVKNIRMFSFYLDQNRTPEENRAIVSPGLWGRIAELLSAHSEYSKRDFFITLVPHLQTFSGLNALVGKEFDNPDKYETAELAFADVVIKIKNIINI